MATKLDFLGLNKLPLLPDPEDESLNSEFSLNYSPPEGFNESSLLSSFCSDPQQQPYITEEPLPIHLTFLRAQGGSSAMVDKVGFHLWHDYDSNPKKIHLLVSKTNSTFVQWDVFLLEQKSGMHNFRIKPIPLEMRYLKLVILENYGGKVTYLNSLSFSSERRSLAMNSMKSTHKSLSDYKRKRSEADNSKLQRSMRGPKLSAQMDFPSQLKSPNKSSDRAIRAGRGSPAQGVDSIKTEITELALKNKKAKLCSNYKDLATLKSIESDSEVKFEEILQGRNGLETKIKEMEAQMRSLFAFKADVERQLDVFGDRLETLENKIERELVRSDTVEFHRISMLKGNPKAGLLDLEREEPKEKPAEKEKAKEKPRDTAREEGGMKDLVSQLRSKLDERTKKLRSLELKYDLAKLN